MFDSNLVLTIVIGMVMNPTKARTKKPVVKFSRWDNLGKTDVDDMISAFAISIFLWAINVRVLDKNAKYRPAPTEVLNVEGITPRHKSFICVSFCNSLMILVLMWTLLDCCC